MTILFTITASNDSVTRVEDDGYVNVWYRTDNPAKFDAWIAATLSIASIFEADEDERPNREKETFPVDADGVLDNEDDLDDNCECDIEPTASDFKPKFQTDLSLLTRQLLSHANIKQQSSASLNTISNSIFPVAEHATYLAGFEQGYTEAVMLLRNDPTTKLRRDALKGLLTTENHGWWDGWNKGQNDFNALAMHQAEMERLARVAAAHALADTQGYDASSPIYGHTTPNENRDDPRWHVNMAAEEIEKFVLDHARIDDVEVPQPTLHPTRK